MMRAVPAVIAFLALACGLLLPRVDELYISGHVAALVLAFAVPAAHGWIERNRGRSGDGARRFLFPGMMVLAVLSAVASSMLLALGSVEGSAGDIGCFALWILSTAGLLGLSLAVIDFGDRRAAKPPTRGA
ncbi:hypothetical protein [Paeniglutamicibacter kerguelensis]|uniref:Uncharacterized protein n=1 Tax=Paeniglutamicibacter kerguelensis TaxID=254788 RepID=A0ABS4XJH2_9MICC|nr:hypothetical protein [Paeniglutamicibacter kerguelensis]MBP2388612.1 hypothetical protein [Paeniglutamicibacter kerguelensis]